MLALYRHRGWIVSSLVVLSLMATGCSTMREPASPPAAEAPPEVANDFATLGASDPRAFDMPHHAVPGNPAARGDSPRRYPIAVAPLRTYGCCH